MAKKDAAHGLWRRQFLGGAGALAFTGLSGAKLLAQQPATATTAVADLVMVNGKIHTMDPNNRVVSQALIQNGRFAAVGNNVAVPRGVRRIDLKGKTVIPGLIDAHNHIVLVGNRPGWHTPLEHVFTIPDAIAALNARAAEVPRGEFITTVGPVSAMQFMERRLPTLAELDAVDRPVYIQAAQGGTRTNTQGKVWLEARGVMVAADGAITGPSLANSLQAMRKELLTPETRKRSALDALKYYAKLGITTHRDCGAFHADLPSGGVANENTYTMHNAFLALHREGTMPARLRIDFLHQDSATANPPLPTLSARLKNSFPFFGDEWIKTGGIGEFTGGGVEGLRAIAKAGWRAEDHALSLAMVTNLIKDRETVNAEIPLSGLRWIISHVPEFPMDLANRMNAMGMGVLLGWGPLRTGTNVGPPYRMLMTHPIKKGYHSDGGDITIINPWVNFSTITTGKNLAGQQILGDQTLTRQEVLWLATAANKWFIEEDDLGSIEIGNHGDLAVLDRDCFAVPDEDLKHTRSLLTVVGGKVVHNDGVL
ncbi:MAG: putative amidohydrolase family protein [Bryobacterales bacterium]|nr:putative amidohydrolase family protein [Bryobacterales bacterium]